MAIIKLPQTTSSLLPDSSKLLGLVLRLFLTCPFFLKMTLEELNQPHLALCRRRKFAGITHKPLQNTMAGWQAYSSNPLPRWCNSLFLDGGHSHSRHPGVHCESKRNSRCQVKESGTQSQLQVTRGGAAGRIA